MSRDYISSVAQFASDSMSARVHYERTFLEHRERLARVASPRSRPITDSWNDEVFDRTQGLRARLAHNHTVNPQKDTRDKDCLLYTSPSPRD